MSEWLGCETRACKSLKIEPKWAEKIIISYYQVTIYEATGASKVVLRPLGPSKKYLGLSPYFRTGLRGKIRAKIKILESWWLTKGSYLKMGSSMSSSEGNCGLEFQCYQTSKLNFKGKSRSRVAFSKHFKGFQLWGYPKNFKGFQGDPLKILKVQGKCEGGIIKGLFSL